MFSENVKVIFSLPRVLNIGVVVVHGWSASGDCHVAWDRYKNIILLT